MGEIPLGEVLFLREAVLGAPVELALPAQRNMMLVLRLTTAGVVARAGLTVDRMDDVKLAVEEACSCLIREDGGPQLLRLRFTEADGALHIAVCSEGGSPAPIGEDDREVVRCILESLVDGVELRMDGAAVTGVELRVALGA